MRSIRALVYTNADITCWAWQHERTYKIKRVIWRFSLFRRGLRISWSFQFVVYDGYRLCIFVTSFIVGHSWAKEFPFSWNRVVQIKIVSNVTLRWTISSICRLYNNTNALVIVISDVSTLMCPLTTLVVISLFFQSRFRKGRWPWKSEFPIKIRPLIDFDYIIPALILSELRQYFFIIRRISFGFNFFPFLGH